MRPLAAGAPAHLITSAPCPSTKSPVGPNTLLLLRYGATARYGRVESGLRQQGLKHGGKEGGGWREKNVGRSCFCFLLLGTEVDRGDDVGLGMEVFEEEREAPMVNKYGTSSLV